MTDTKPEISLRDLLMPEGRPAHPTPPPTPGSFSAVGAMRERLEAGETLTAKDVDDPKALNNAVQSLRNQGREVAATPVGDGSNRVAYSIRQPSSNGHTPPAAEAKPEESEPVIEAPTVVDSAWVIPIPKEITKTGRMRIRLLNGEAISSAGKASLDGQDLSNATQSLRKKGFTVKTDIGPDGLTLYSVPDAPSEAVYQAYRERLMPYERAASNRVYKKKYSKSDAAKQRDAARHRAKTVEDRKDREARQKIAPKVDPFTEPDELPQFTPRDLMLGDRLQVVSMTLKGGVRYVVVQVGDRGLLRFDMDEPEG